MKTFGFRLREERQRLSLNQEELAHYGGVKRGAQINYEKDERVPDANYMSSIANIGVDIHYVLTGERMTRREAKQQGKLQASPAFQQAMEKFEAEDDGDESRDDEPFNINTPATYRLSQEEWKLIQRFRSASFEERFSIMQAAMAVDMSNKTIDDYQPEPINKPKKSITVVGSGNRTAGRDYNEHPPKKK